MLAGMRCFLIAALFLAAGSGAVLAQGEDDESKYEGEYNRVQLIVKVADPAKRAEQLVAFYKGHPKMDPRIKDFADYYLKQDLTTLSSQQKNALVKKYSQDVLSANPKSGIALFFMGITLKNENKLDEAINALAKSSLIPSIIQSDAKKQLDLSYRAAHNGSMVGQPQLLKKIQAEMAK
jgi:hypothetical protein